ncbi:MAG TPA: hypothetical protein VF533_09480 [Solirubrobacteraceae bacterium]
MSTATATARRLVLVPGRRTSSSSPAEAALRRYRLARVRVEDPAAARRRRDPERFAHLRRAYD